MIFCNRSICRTYEIFDLSTSKDRITVPIRTVAKIEISPKKYIEIFGKSSDINLDCPLNRSGCLKLILKLAFGFEGQFVPYYRLVFEEESEINGHITWEDVLYWEVKRIA